MELQHLCSSLIGFCGVSSDTPFRAISAATYAGAACGLVGTRTSPYDTKEPPYMPQLRWVQKYGSVFTYRLLWQRRIIVADPKILQRILVSEPLNFPKPKTNLGALRALVGDGLLLSEGAVHARQRAGISPAFHHENLQHYLPAFSRDAVLLSEKWYDLLKGSDAGEVEIDVHNIMAKLTLDVIGHTAFSYDFNALQNDDNTVYNAYTSIFESSGLSLTALIPFWHLLPTPANRKRATGIKFIRSTVAKIIQQKRDKIRIDTGPQSTRDLLDVMLEAKDPSTGAPLFSDEQLTDQVLTFLVAGHETSSNGLCWTFFLFAQHPEVEAKVRDELRHHLSGRAPTWEDLKKLDYLNATIREVLRLYPPAPIVQRVTARDEDIGGFAVPKGTPIVISSGVMGRLPQFWRDPDEFRPERFLDSSSTTQAEDAPDVKKRHTPSTEIPKDKEVPFSWIPFVAGPRSCIGNRFATLEMAAALAVLVPRFTLKLIEGKPVRPKLFITMRPYPHLHMKLKAVPA